MSSAGGVQQCSLDSVLPQKAKEKNLHSDSPQAHGLGKVTEMFQASVSFPPISSPASEPHFNHGGRNMSNSQWGLNCPCGCIQVLIVSAEHTQGTLVSHSESHCAGPKTCAGSEERVLLMSCTGYKVRRSHSLWGSC